MAVNISGGILNGSTARNLKSVGSLFSRDHDPPKKKPPLGGFFLTTQIQPPFFIPKPNSSSLNQQHLLKIFPILKILLKILNITIKTTNPLTIQFITITYYSFFIYLFHTKHPPFHLIIHHKPYSVNTFLLERPPPPPPQPFLHIMFFYRPLRRDS